MIRSFCCWVKML